jgi:hypothetical protein
MSEQTLYQRLGGYDAVAAATDDLLPRLLNDPLLKAYFKGMSQDSRRCHCGSQPDRATQGEDDHPRSSVRTLDSNQSRRPRGSRPAAAQPARIRRSARVAAAEHYQIAVRIVAGQIDALAELAAIRGSSVPATVR